MKMKVSKNVTLDFLNVQRISDYAKKRGQPFSFALNAVVSKWYYINQEYEKQQEQDLLNKAKVLKDEK